MSRRPAMTSGDMAAWSPSTGRNPNTTLPMEGERTMEHNPATETAAEPGRSANIGVVGLAVMGSNLARNLASREGNTVAVYNRTYARTQELLDEHGDVGFVASESIDDFVASLAKPRTA